MLFLDWLGTAEDSVTGDAHTAIDFLMLAVMVNVFEYTDLITLRLRFISLGNCLCYTVLYLNMTFMRITCKSQIKICDFRVLRFLKLSLNLNVFMYMVKRSKIKAKQLILHESYTMMTKIAWTRNVKLIKK